MNTLQVELSLQFREERLVEVVVCALTGAMPGGSRPRKAESVYSVNAVHACFAGYDGVASFIAPVVLFSVRLQQVGSFVNRTLLLPDILCLTISSIAFMRWTHQ